MFTLELSDTYFCEVTMHLKDHEGRVKPYSFDAEFKRLTTDEHEALMKRAREEKLSDPQVAAEVMVGWRKVFCADGSPRPYTPESLRALLQINGAGTAVCKAYLDSVSAVGRGN